MKSKHQETWIKEVFSTIEVLHSDMIKAVNQRNIKEIQKCRERLQDTYTALRNLDKSFTEDSYFIGFNTNL